MSRNLFIAHDDHIEAGVVGRLIMRARAPSQATGIVKSLRLAVRRVNEVRVGGAKISGEFVQGGPPDEHAGRRVEHAVFRIEFRDGGATPGRIAFAENLLQITMKQITDTVVHNTSP